MHFLFFHVRYSSLPSLPLDQQSTLVFTPTLGHMDFIILDYVDDVLILDYTDYFYTDSDLQTLVVYYLLYHNFSHPALIHAASE